MTCNDAAVVAYCQVVRSVMRGEVPQWYSDNYGDDSEKLWSDIIEATTLGTMRDPTHFKASKVGLINAFAGEFGGYCSPAAVTNAMFDSDTTISNPWVDGGCEPKAPPTVTVTSGTLANTFEVSWTEPDAEGGAKLSGYEVQWKRGNQAYDDTRLTTVADNVLTTTIDVGTGNQDTYIRVRAVNEIGKSTGGEATCTYSGGAWTCTFEPPASRSQRSDSDAPRRWPASPEIPKPE